MDRVERFLSIWEEEGCRMVPMLCRDHDTYAANSQFITHLVGRILGAQGLSSTPIDTKGFESVLKLIENTNADSFDCFTGCIRTIVIAGIPSAVYEGHWTMLWVSFYKETVLLVYLIMAIDETSINHNWTRVFLRREYQRHNVNS